MTEPGDALARQMRKYRHRRGWSIRQLAEECHRLGAPELTTASLTNIERGQRAGAIRRRRDVTVDELFILAYALAVPPLLLVFPLGEDNAIAVTATVEIHPHLAWKWATGDEPPTDSDGRAVQLEAWHRNTRPVILYRRLEMATKDMRAAWSNLRVTEEIGSADRIESARERWVSALRGLADVLNQMAESGIKTPGYAAEVLSDMRRLGLLRYPDTVPVLTEGATASEHPNQ